MITTNETTPTVKSDTRHGLRAPRGGCTVNGKVYRGGSFCLPYDESNPHELPAVEAKPEAVRTTINGFVYAVEAARIHPEVGSVAFRMTKLVTNNAYLVHRDIFGEVRCDCPDFEFRLAGTGRTCKHGQALVSLGIVGATTPNTARPGRGEPTRTSPVAPARRSRYEVTPEDFAEACELFREPAACC